MRPASAGGLFFIASDQIKTAFQKPALACFNPWRPVLALGNGLV
jgi:hypothetical protein